MKEIDTRVITYDPELYNVPYDSETFVVMEVAEDGTGAWVNIAEHESIVRALQQRIVVLENVCDDQMRMLTGD